MADNRNLWQELLPPLPRLPTEGYEDAIVVPEIEAANFEIKHGLLTLVQNKQFFGHDKEDPHAHIRVYFLDNGPLIAQAISEASKSKSFTSRKQDISSFQLPLRKRVEQKLCYLRWWPTRIVNCRLPIEQITEDNIQDYVSQASRPTNFNQGNFRTVTPRMAYQIRQLGFPPCNTTAAKQSEALEPEPKPWE
ncbi:hypothetical protein Tco_0232503 [Tanacetum coccineum]